MCPFCDPARRKDELLSTEHFFVIADRAPVVRGHALVISKRHVESLLELTPAEWEDYHAALRTTLLYLDRVCQPDGYCMGNNKGRAAGQTVFHFHEHIFPRYKGDVDDPRGGIRNFTKPLRQLWPDE